VSSASAGRPTVRCVRSPPSLPCSGHFTPRRTQPTPSSNLHRRMAARRGARMAGRRGARRTDSAPDRPSARRGQPVRPCCGSAASSGDCLYTANNARSTAGLTSAGLDGRTDVARRCFDREGATVAIVMSRYRAVIVGKFALLN